MLNLYPMAFSKSRQRIAPKVQGPTSQNVKIVAPRIGFSNTTAN